MDDQVRTASAAYTILSTYLGHAHISDTYWYLSAHPQLMGLAKRRLEKRWENWP